MQTSTTSAPTSPTCWSAFSEGNLNDRITALQQRAAGPDFWNHPEEAASTLQELHRCEALNHQWATVAEELDLLHELAHLTDDDPDLNEQLDRAAEPIAAIIAEAKLSLALSHHRDSSPAIITIQAGTGGTEAQYWAETLTGMYCGWAKLHKRDADVLSVQYAHPTGFRQATIRITGDHPYGYLRGEAGVHRLSRVSDFDPSQRRHTSFARVEVLPEMPRQSAEFTTDPAEIKTDYFRASGPGGQHVQKVATAVRLTHKTTGITAVAQSERSQKQNLEAAHRILATRLAALQQEQDEARAREIRGQIVPAQWGNHIRSYILNPNQLVADHRTGLKLPDAHSVLSGQLDELIQSHFDHRIKQPGAVHTAA